MTFLVNNFHVRVHYPVTRRLKPEDVLNNQYCITHYASYYWLHFNADLISSLADPIALYERVFTTDSRQYIEAYSPLRRLLYFSTVFRTDSVTAAGDANTRYLTLTLRRRRRLPAEVTSR